MAWFNDVLAHNGFDIWSEFVKRNGTSVRFDKGETFVMRGSKCRYVGIIKSGYFKYVSVNSAGEEVITGFLFIGEPITDYAFSFLNNIPCQTSIVAGEKAEVVCVPMDSFKEYVSQNNFIETTTRAILLGAYQRYLDVYIKTPAERYHELAKQHPDLIEIIPAKELATYLGISPRQFQRIRLGEKNQHI